MTTEAMRAAFEAWWESVGAPSPYAVWQAATLAERERFAEIWENGAAQAAIDYANGHPVNFTAGAERIRKGETP